MEITPLNAELQRVANEELNEVTERIPQDLQALKTWIHQQPHLNARIDDQFLIQFLRGCKYSLERAKEKLDHFYALKTKYPELFGATNVDDVKFREYHNLGILVPLPIPLKGSGPRISIFRYNYSVDKHHIERIMITVNAMQEVMMLSDPYACIHGMVYVVDMAKTTVSHYLQFTPSLVKKLVSFYEKTLPLRIKSVYCINVSPVAEPFLKLILSLISEKLRQRFFISGRNMKDLSDSLPLKYLPIEYGGSNGSLNTLCAEYNKVWDNYRAYFKQNAEYGTDERLRSGKPIDFEGLFGMGGSFRKINVD